MDSSALYTGIGTGSLYVFSPFSLANLLSIVVPVHLESNRVMMLRVSPDGVSKVALISNVLSDCLLCYTNLGFYWSSCNTNWVLSLLISLSCWINLGVTCSWWYSCTKDLTCLMACSSSLESTTFLIHWDIHGSTVFIHPCHNCLSPFSGRIAIAKGLDDSAVFLGLGHLSIFLGRITWGDSVAFADCSLWLCCLSTFSGRVPQGDLAAFTDWFLGLLRIEIFRVSATPVDLKPWLPHFVLSRVFSLFSLSRLIFSTINWAMWSPIFTSNCILEWFTNRTFTSPQSSLLMMPAVMSMPFNANLLCGAILQ